MLPLLGNQESLSQFLPELVLAVGALVLFLVDLVARDFWRKATLLGITAATLAGAGVATAWTGSQLESPLWLFHGLLALDPWALLFKYLALVAVGLSVWMAASSHEISLERLGEYCALLLSIAVGLCLMASANDLLMAAVGIELVSLVSYALAGFRRGDGRSAEAALKYVIYGGVASGTMLFGMSYLYGLSGATTWPEIAQAVRELGDGALATKATVLLAVTFTLSGLAFKMALVPWHMWCPDVYEGAPTPFTAFLSVGPKAAGFALLVRIFHGAFSQAGPLHGAGLMTSVAWPEVMGVVSALTMTVGNFAALSQTQLKRMLAYSSIAHAGYVLMGFSAASSAGTQAVAFYLWIYLFMNVGAFLVVGAVGRATGAETLAQFRGLSSRAPFLAVALALFLFSLTGLPPLAGFVGKFHLFKALIEHGGGWQWSLAVVGVLNSAVSLYYYAKVVRAMFLEPAGELPRVSVSGSYQLLLASLLVAVVGLGVFVEPLRQFSERSMSMATTLRGK